MFSLLLSFLFGLVCALGGVFVLLFRWNPRPALDRTLAQRRRSSQHARDLTPFEERQSSFFQSHVGLVESCVGLNSIVGYVFAHVAEMARSTAADGRLEEYLNTKVLSKIKYPHFVSPVVVSELSIGASLPSLESVSVIQADPAEPLMFDIRVSYDGSAFVCVESGVGINAPVMNLAVLPIELALKGLRFDFTARVQLDVSALPTVGVSLSLLSSPPPSFDFDIHSHIGASLILSDLHILQTIFQRVLQEVIDEQVTQPNTVDFQLKLW